MKLGGTRKQALNVEVPSVFYAHKYPTQSYFKSRPFDTKSHQKESEKVS